jgi:lysophospholipid acyltransferase (LPLAT)-like uncharacterized protein
MEACMKIRKKWMLDALGFLGALLVRLWIGTLRYRYRPMGLNVDPNQPSFQGRYLYAFWHENLLLPAYHYGLRNIWVLISEHADGELIATACRHLGFSVVRGSLTRGGVKAVRSMLSLSRKGHLAITPDGPRGPRRHLQPGLVYLASRTGLPIIPVGIAYERAWRLRSWDRFALPWPWSAAWVVTGAPVVVPPDLDRDGLEDYRRRVEQALHEADAAAERLAGLTPEKIGTEEKVIRPAA